MGDQPKSLAQFEALSQALTSKLPPALGRLAKAAPLPQDAREFMWRRVFDTRSDIAEEKVVAGVKAAAAQFAWRFDALHVTDVVEGTGGEQILRMQGAPGWRLPGENDDGIIDVTLRLVSGPGGADAPARESPVGLMSNGSRHEMVVRADASDAALSVGVVGALAYWLTRTAVPVGLP